MVFENFRSRDFICILYPEDNLGHLFSLERMKKQHVQYCYIEHKSDVWSEDDPKYDPEKHILGKPKKPHVHLYVRFPNARYVDGFCKDYKIERNLVEKPDNVQGCLRYWSHKDYPNKFQYDPLDCVGPLSKEMISACSDHKESESEKVQRLIDLIDSMPVPCSYKKLLVAVCAADLYSTFRRMGFGVSKLLEEHNEPAVFDEFKEFL